MCLCTADAADMATLSPGELKEMAIDLIVDKSNISEIADAVLAGFNTSSSSSASPGRVIIETDSNLGSI